MECPITWGAARRYLGDIGSVVSTFQRIRFLWDVLCHLCLCRLFCSWCFICGHITGEARKASFDHFRRFTLELCRTAFFVDTPEYTDLWSRPIVMLTPNTAL